MPRRRPGRRRSRRRVATPPGAPTRKAPARAAAEGPPTAQRRDPLIGQVVGRCRIEARIGQGRTATVYRAHHEALDATVAVKVLLPQSAARPELVEKFETEARAIARIDNENVVKIYDVASEGDLHYIVMELLEGEEVLDIVTREGHLDTMDALRITRQAANGLAAAHARNIVHRDVKPQNLVLLEDGTVKVVDFGLAGIDQAGSGRVGTPHFMAPETCDSKETSTASDVYSLGITLYHVLVGQPPYAGQDVPAILRSHTRCEPLHPERRRPGLPQKVAEFVRYLTQKDPSARPTAQQVLEALDRLGGDALQEKTTLRRRRSRTRARMASARQSNMVPALIAILLVVGAIIAVIALGSRGKDDAPQDSTEKASTQPVLPTIPSREPPAQPPARLPPRPASPPQPPLEDDPEVRGYSAFREAEEWARQHWHTPEDNAAVVARYRRVSSRHTGTKAAKEADERIRQIQAGMLHAHPDRKFDDADNVAAATASWKRVLPQVEGLVKKHLYLKAKNLVPTQVSDGTGAIGRELAFWRTCLTHLMQFKTGLSMWVPELTERRREIKTARGTGVVEKISTQFLTVTIDGKKTQVRWTEVEPEELASLARAAFQEAPQQYLLYSLAFAFAHCLWDSFFSAQLDLSLGDMAGPEQDFVLREYEKRFEDRKASHGD